VSLHRRQMLLALALASTGGCRRPPARAEVLAALGREVALPGYRRLAASAAHLACATRRLEARPDRTALAAARRAWSRVLVDLSFTWPLRVGPVADQRLHLRAAYWPVRPAAIDALAAAPLDEATLGRAGAAVKGLFAIEYLLFDPPGTIEGRGRMLVLLAEELQRLAAAVAEGARREDLPRALAARGQEGVALLVNGLVETVETARASLEPPALDRPAPAVVLLPGARGGAVQVLALGRLEGTAAHYLGGPGPGLTTLVQAISPAVDRSVRRALAGARAALVTPSAMGAPQACRALEIALKTDLTGALGVTLTVQSADGD